MAEAKEKSDWNRTSLLVVKMHNLKQVKRSDLIDIKDVHPFYIQEQMTAIKEPSQSDLTTLKSAIRGMKYAR